MDDDAQVFLAPGYPADVVSTLFGGGFDASFDVFSVGVTLFEMATGELPDLSLERDALLAAVDDPLKRELVAFTLQDAPSDRPTAEQLLRKLTSLAPSEASKQELEFRKAVDAKAPWGLDARALTEWLTQEWVESGTADEKEQRRALVLQLSDADGVALLSKCMIDDAKVPWVKLSHTKSGEPIEDKERAEQLTSFLHDHAGLVFYHQLFCVSTSMSPLSSFEFERRMGSSETAVAGLVRSRHCATCASECSRKARSSEQRVVKFIRQDEGRSAANEIELTMKAGAASEYVQTGYHYGPGSPDVIFIVSEATSSKLKDLIEDGRGIEDDKRFWQLAHQLTRGVADMHASGMVHLSIEVRHRARARAFPRHNMTKRPSRAAQEYSPHRQRRRANHSLPSRLSDRYHASARAVSA